MNHDIDDLIRAASASPSKTRLTDLEAGVWKRVLQSRDRALSRRLQASGLALAVAIGVVGGGLMSQGQRPSPSDLHVFTVEAGLAPFSISSDLG